MKRYFGTIHAYKDWQGRTFYGPMKPNRHEPLYKPIGVPMVYRVNVYGK